MESFQQLLTEAAQLKQHQLKQQRKNYEQLPEFIKSGLNYSNKYEQIRKQHFLYQFRISTNLRRQGNVHFKAQQYEQAQSKYEEALSIFKYITTKSYENMKDSDLTHQQFDTQNLSLEMKNKYNENLNAIYLNICHCLTKLNRKQQALYSADLALKIQKTAKGYYKKAQAYLQFINRDETDYKLGLLQLKEAYNLSNDNFILGQMHKVKKEFEEQRKKQKEWFKFMFTKNKQKKVEQSEESIQEQKKQTVKKPEKQCPGKDEKMRKMLEESEINSIKQSKKNTNHEKILEYVKMDEEWLLRYQADFIKKYSSQIYSIMNIYGYSDYAPQYRSLLARCLSTNSEKQLGQSFDTWMQWLRMHPIQRIVKYIKQYDFQVDFIKKKRDESKKREKKKSEKVEQRPKMMKQQSERSHNEEGLEFIEQVKQIVRYEQTKKNQKVEQGMKVESFQKFWIIFMLLCVAWIVLKLFYL